MKTQISAKSQVALERMLQIRRNAAMLQASVGREYWQDLERRYHAARKIESK